MVKSNSVQIKGVAHEIFRLLFTLMVDLHYTKFSSRLNYKKILEIYFNMLVARNLKFVKPKLTLFSSF